ncbi:hypothetical protein BJ508DRAFT_181857 [Ascobolus immersus RN42]|uniref:Uncharacterized protein n=1 Tax=Ascobolus immersus RN42 TaxID=1160509 RepID=A0A3N4I490_ASCIM|nr:hypothetical protein BJ508DRAFT_181857 [Ascobolus immersus RN42]
MSEVAPGHVCKCGTCPSTEQWVPSSATFDREGKRGGWRTVLADFFAERRPWPCHFSPLFQSTLSLVAVSESKTDKKYTKYYVLYGMMEVPLMLPLSIYEAVEEAFIFFLRDFQPILNSEIRSALPPPTSKYRKHLCSQAEYFELVYFWELREIIDPGLAGHSGNCRLRERHKAMLMRVNQARLIALAVKILVDSGISFLQHVAQRRSVMKTPSGELHIATEIVSLRGVLHFFIDRRFRSERLEHLLVKYIAQTDDINSDVISGLVAAQVEFTNRQYLEPNKARPSLRVP